MEELIAKVQAILPNLSAESAQFVDEFLSTAVELQLPAGLDSTSWLQGFLAAALRNVSIAVDTNQTEDYALHKISIDDSLLMKKVG